MKKRNKLNHSLFKRKRPGKLCPLILIVFLLLFLLMNFTIREIKAEENLVEQMKEVLHFDELTEEEISQGKYYRIIDEKDGVITVTGRKIYIDDEYITSDNKHYRVYKVDDYTAYAKLEGIIRLTPPEQFLKRNISRETSFRDTWEGPWFGSEYVQGEDQPTRAIAIYHTHNAESYVPTDGTDSIRGKGGIHEVGAAFQESLETKGIKALFREDLHIPHDRAAYRRSRQTALELLEQEPDAIFDVHRDAAPSNAYATTIDGVPATKIQVVVGRQNPHMEVNRKFALDLKSISDQIHPGLIKGIFLAQGNYNQDLTPLNLLLEVGAHTNSRESAENGITFFADAVGQYFYGTEAEEDEEEVSPGRAAAQRPPDGGNTVRMGIIRIISIAAIIGITFFILNAGTWADFKEKYGDRLKEYQEELYIIRDRSREYLIKFGKWVNKKLH